MLKCVPIIFAYTFMNLLYYNVSFRQSLIFSAIDYAVIVLVDYVILCFCMIISPETGQAVIEKEHLPGLIAKTIWIIILLIIRKCSKPMLLLLIQAVWSAAFTTCSATYFVAAVRRVAIIDLFSQ